MEQKINTQVRSDQIMIIFMKIDTSVTSIKSVSFIIIMHYVREEYSYAYKQQYQHDSTSQMPLLLLSFYVCHITNSSLMFIRIYRVCER